jgi:hypothetical protein
MNKENNIQTMLPPHLANSNVFNYVKSFCDLFDTVESDLIELRDSLFIETARGEDLDILGKLFSLNRLSQEKDDNFRNRIKSYFAAIIEGGSANGLKNSISAITGFSPDTIIINEFETYFFREPIDFLNGTDYTGTGVTDDTIIYYESYEKKSIKFTSSGEITLTATNNSPPSLSDINKFNGISFWGRIDDLTILNSLSLRFTDNNSDTITKTITDFPFTDIDTWYQIDMDVLEEDLDLNWNNITKIEFIADFGGAGILNLDYLFFSERKQNNKFSVEIEIGDDTNLNKYDNIPQIVNLVKPVGSLFEEFVIISRNKIFRYNLSGYNSDDRLV